MTFAAPFTNDQNFSLPFSRGFLGGPLSSDFIEIQAGARVAIIGTSLIDSGARDHEESVHRGFSDRGVSSWLRSGLGQQIELHNFGIGGNNITEITNRFESDIVTSGFDTVIIAAGTNDSTLTYESIISKLATLYAKATSNNLQLIIELIPMRSASGSGAWSQTVLEKMLAVNEWIKANYPNWIDPNIYFTDPATQRPYPSFIVDAVHYFSTGAYAVYKSYIEKIKIKGSLNPLKTSLTLNPTLSGTSGSVTLPVTGTAPDNYSIVNDSEAGHMPTITCVANDPSLTISLTPSGVAGQEGVRIQLPQLDTDLDPSKLYEFFARIQASDWSGWREISLRFRRDGTSDINSYDMWDDYKDTHFPSDGFVEPRLLRTPPIPIVENDTTRFVPYIYVYFDGDATGSGDLTVDLGQVQDYVRPANQDLAANFPDIEVGFRANTSAKLYTATPNEVEEIYGRRGVPFRDYGDDDAFLPTYDPTAFDGRGGMNFTESTNTRLIANANIPANCIMYGVFETTAAENGGNRDIAYFSTGELVQSDKRFVMLGSSGQIRWYAGEGGVSSEIVGNSTIDYRGERVAYILAYRNGVMDGWLKSSNYEYSEFDMDIDDDYIDTTRLITSGREILHAEQWLSHATFASTDITPDQLMNDLCSRWGI